jgi:hypothetical protein
VGDGDGVGDGVGDDVGDGVSVAEGVAVTAVGDGKCSVASTVMASSLAVA